MKINITMNDELVKRIEAYAEENYTSKSGTISIAVNQYLNAQELGRNIKVMAIAMRKIADEGQLDQETINQLQDFERFVKVLTGTK